LDRQKCQDLRQQISEDIDILGFGEFLLKKKFCRDFKQMQELVNDAFLKAEEGLQVPRNPFTAMSLRSSSPKRADEIIDPESFTRAEPPEQPSNWPDRKSRSPMETQPPMPQWSPEQASAQQAPHSQANQDPYTHGQGGYPQQASNPDPYRHTHPSFPQQPGANGYYSNSQQGYPQNCGQSHPAYPHPGQAAQPFPPPSNQENSSYPGQGHAPMDGLPPAPVEPPEHSRGTHVEPAQNIDEIRASIRRRISSVEHSAEEKRRGGHVHDIVPEPEHPVASHPSMVGGAMDVPMHATEVPIAQEPPPRARVPEASHESVSPRGMSSTDRLAAMETQAPFERPEPIRQETPVKKLSTNAPVLDLNVPDAWPDCEDLRGLGSDACRRWMVQLLLKAQKEGVSDVHISAESRLFVRKSRGLQILSEHILSVEEAEMLNLCLLSDEQKDRFGSEHDLDYALAVDDTHRYRVNLMEHMDGPAGTYRIVPDRIRGLEELGFQDPDSLRKLLSYHNGLILVTGPVGSGKTATLAALVDELNRTREDHVITVESPIEVVQKSESCQITQREVGSHTKSFKTALKGALRQDPDIIVIGEMTNLETIEMAISASETGHLVIGTMHTSDAATTLNRLLDVFPAAQQTQIRAMVSESLKGILCQRLLPSTDGDVVLSYELLLNNAAVRNLIRENKSEGLGNVMETGLREGMRIMDRSIMELWEEGRISDNIALENLISRRQKQRIEQGDTEDEPEPVAAGGGQKRKGFFAK